MAEEKEKETFLQKLLFYTNAFFILLGTFSFFAFLFLVPFVIDPAFNTIFMQFDTRPTECITVDVESKRGTSNCSWSSCREGCTKELYDCTQIRVNYKLPTNASSPSTSAEGDEGGRTVGGVEDDEGERPRFERTLRDYDYLDEDHEEDFVVEDNDDRIGLPSALPTGLMGNDSEWYFTGAKLFPNVKGCGYPPILNCSVFYRRYAEIGKKFSCYYSKVDPGIVISDLDMWQVYMNLVYAVAIPIPSFIISVIYLTIIYFKIYSEEQVVLIDGEVVDDEMADEEKEEGEPSGGGVEGGALTPRSEVFRDNLVSFGHQLNVAMADENSRESLDGIPNSLSAQGNFSKTMTTSISTPPGPMAAV